MTGKIKTELDTKEQFADYVSVLAWRMICKQNLSQ